MGVPECQSRRIAISDAITQSRVDERLTYFRPQALPGTEILLGERSPRLWRVYHETYVVCTGIDTASDWTYRRQSHSLCPGALMLMEPGETHVNTFVARPQDFKVVFISPDRVERASREMGLQGAPHFRLAQLENEIFFGAFSRFHACVESGETALEQQSRLASCLQLLLEHCIENRAGPLQRLHEPRAVERARSYLYEHFAESVSLDELSLIAGLGAFQLLRSFANRFGLPPHAFQLRLRLARARTLLAAGIGPAAVAAELGFADQSHLARHFKRVLGVSPGRYARGGS